MTTQGGGSTGPLILFGAAVGLLFMFKPVRWIVLILLSILGIMFFWDKFVTQTDVPASSYTFSVDSAEPQSYITWMEHNPIFIVKGSFHNRSHVFIQSAVMQSTLYDCPSASSPITACDKISTWGSNLQLDAQPGMRKGFNITVHFPNAENQNRNLRVLNEVKDVVGDTDRTE